jgi:TrpR family trp operon transcriptional repressor
MKKSIYTDEFIEKILSLKNKDELLGFFELILSSKELDEIPKRLQIARMLKKGLSQREIAKSLGVGIATVTRGSKEIRARKVTDL